MMHRPRFLRWAQRIADRLRPSSRQWMRNRAKYSRRAWRSHSVVHSAYMGRSYPIRLPHSMSHPIKRRRYLGRAR